MPRYVCESKSGGKFWEIELDGSSFTVTYGKVGTAGTSKTTDLGTVAKCEKKRDTLIKQKNKKGYVLADSEEAQQVGQGVQSQHIKYIDNTANGYVTQPFTTKFGGAPVWLTEPAWPRSASHPDLPMKFLAQIALDPKLFKEQTQKGHQTVIYIFITSSPNEDDDIDGTWEEDGGENAAIVQIKKTTRKRKSSGVSTKKPKPQPEEKVLETVLVQPEMIAEVTETVFEHKAADGNKARTDPDDCEMATKIGGVANFLQAVQYPAGGPDEWTLVFQFHSNLHMMGDCGLGYVFISADGTQAKYLWQS
jgi:predicted DNA-binding WGR domain protein